MGSKARKAGTNKKPTAGRAKAHDRRLLEQAEREGAEGQGKIEAARAHEAMAPADVYAKPAMAAIEVPMTLGEICLVIGQDVVSHDFASTALRSIADQLLTTAALAETDLSDDAWRLFANLSARAELAGRVAGWLESKRGAA